MAVRELHKRSNNGLTVTLYADFTDTENVVISCHVTDVENGEDFTIEDIPHNQVMEVFKHPQSCGRKLLERGSLAGAVA